ncbi:hypothetical protein DV738_g2070, partial [Chaetothyriales sp. CBS 135597]
MSDPEDVERFPVSAPVINGRKPVLGFFNLFGYIPSRIQSASLRSSESATSEKFQRPPPPPQGPRRMSSLQESAQTMLLFFKQELDISHMGIVIVLCFFISGIIDSVAFNSWSCFWTKSLVSIGSFCLGTLFFNAVHRWPTGLGKKPTSLRRSILVTSFLVQTGFVTIAAILVSLDLVSTKPFVAGEFSSGSPRRVLSNVNYLDLCPIALLAFQAAGQVCLSRVLDLIELPSIVLSTLFHDFTADLYGVGEAWRKSTSLKDFIFVHWRRQEKRLASMIIFFVGAIVGGEMYKSGAGMVGALWLAVGLKATIVLIFLFWKKDDLYGDQGLPR